MIRMGHNTFIYDMPYSYVIYLMHTCLGELESRCCKTDVGAWGRWGGGTGGRLSTWFCKIKSLNIEITLVFGTY